MYYELVRSFNVLLGEDGLLRLPSYLPKVYVIDEKRRNATNTAIRLLQQGKNVLIVGSPGTGKTALMFMILREITKFAQIGYIIEGVSAIKNDHLEEGTIIFYDDLPRMNRSALRSIFKNNVTGILATARTEELELMRRLLGINIKDHFEIIVIPEMEKEKLKEMLYMYLRTEAIKIVDKEATEIVVEKAQGLPVYVWQVVRELKIRKMNLTKEYAETIPDGMLNYVDNILWRALGGKKERLEALVTLLTMTDFAKYSVHQDLYTYIYLVAKEEKLGKKVRIEDIVMDTVFADFTRYLAREGKTYSYRLPHDSWADVLKGKSNGPMAPEISNINILYTRERRQAILVEAARRAWHETVKKIEDEFRKDAFLKNIEINLGKEALEDILEIPPSKITKKTETIKEIEEKPLKPFEMLEKILEKLGATTIEELAEKMKMNKNDIKEMLNLASDIAIRSNTGNKIYYKKYYWAIIKQTEYTLRIRGFVDLKEIEKETNIEAEDLAKELEKKYILNNDRNKAYTLEHITEMAQKTIRKRGELDVEKFLVEKNLPTNIIEAIKETLDKTYVKGPSGKYYTQRKIEEKIQTIINTLQQKGEINLEKELQRMKVPQKYKEEIEQKLSKIAIKLPNKKHYTKNLQQLNLNFSENDYGDVETTALARAIKNLTNLQQLNLSLNGNKIGNKGAEALARAIKNLTNLQQLNLNFSENDYGDVETTALARAIKNLTNLQQLNLNLDFPLDKIKDRGVEALTEAIKNLTNLQQLNLSLNGNKIGNKGAEALAEAIKNLTNLQQLNLNLDFPSNEISNKRGKQFAQIIESLKRLEKLKKLNINVNLKGPFYYKSLKEITDKIRNLKKLKELNINIDIFGYCSWREDIKELAKTMENLKNIASPQKLDLAFSRDARTYEGALALARVIKNLTNLRQLILNFKGCVFCSDIGNSGVMTLANAIEDLTNLRLLNLNFESNRVRNEGAIALAASIKNLNNLKKLNLNLSFNKIEDKGAIALARAIKSLTNLQRLNLNLEGDDIKDKGAIALAMVIKDLKKLQQLRLVLSRNYIKTEGKKILKELKSTLRARGVEVELFF